MYFSQLDWNVNSTTEYPVSPKSNFSFPNDLTVEAKTKVETKTEQKVGPWRYCEKIIGIIKLPDGLVNKVRDFVLFSQQFD